MHRVLTTCVLGILSLEIVGCQSAQRVGAESVAISRTNNWRSRLTSDDLEEFVSVCRQAFASGNAAVAQLLELAQETSPVAWLPPVQPESGSLIVHPATVRSVAIYLLEAIRVGRLNHSSSPFVSCRNEDRQQCEKNAASEYAHWWKSIEKGEATYEPDVKWAHISEQTWRYLEARDGTSPTGVCLPAGVK
jgi:hypothetical protein